MTVPSAVGEMHAARTVSGTATWAHLDGPVQRRSLPHMNRHGAEHRRRACYAACALLEKKRVATGFLEGALCKPHGARRANSRQYCASSCRPGTSTSVVSTSRHSFRDWWTDARLSASLCIMCSLECLGEDLMQQEKLLNKTGRRKSRRGDVHK